MSLPSPLDISMHALMAQLNMILFGASLEQIGIIAKSYLPTLCEIPAHHLHFVDDWASPNKLSPEDMYSYMKRSTFVPCPSGENAESFRIYEALEAGAVPVLVRDSKEFIEFITTNLPLKVFDSWDDAAIIMNAMSGTKLNEYRTKVLNAWAIYKNTLNRSVKALFKL